MDAKTTYSGVNTGRGPSMSIWGDCPVLDLRTDPNVGHIFFDDFMTQPKTVPTTEGSYGSYKGFTSTSGTIAEPSSSSYAGFVGGGIALSSSSGTDNDAMAIATGSFPFRISSSFGKLWFECRVKVSSISNTISECFVGLMENTALTAIVPCTTTADTLADKNFLGFQRKESDGDYFDTTYKADGQTVQNPHADFQLLVADTFVKLGFVYDPSKPTANRLAFYGDGTLSSTYVTGTNIAAATFPNDVSLGLVFAQRFAAGSITPAFTMDWWQCAQLAV